MAFGSGETKVNSKQHEKGKETEGDGLFFLNQVTRIYECLLCQCLTKCFCELVRTGCWFESALDSFQTLDGIFGLHAGYQF